MEEQGRAERGRMMNVILVPGRNWRRLSLVLVYVAIAAAGAFSASPAPAQAVGTCAPARAGFERCQRRSPDGAIEVERAIAPPKIVGAIFVEPGRGSEQLAQRVLAEAFAANSVPSPARPILRNALEQCIRSGAEITTRIGPVEWQFMREEQFACVVRIGVGRDGVRRAMRSGIL